MLSKKFIAALRMNSQPQYRLALRAGINPDLLSKWIHGYKKPKPDDPRLRKLSKILGVPPFDANGGAA